MNSAGERIRELRIKNHMTLDDVAKHLGVGRQAIYKYEQGTVTNIPLENIEKMAVLFNVAPGYIAGWPVENHCQFEVSTDEKRLINDYRSLSARGQQLLLDRAEELKFLHGKKFEDSSIKSV